MGNIHLDTKHQIFWLNYQYLTSKGVDENAISQWSKRKICKRKYIDGRAYINYDTIPAPTREKLPDKEGLKAEYNRQKTELKEQWCFYRLEPVYKKCDRFPEFVNAILKDGRYNKLSRSQVNYFARRACVIEKAVELHGMHKEKGWLTGLYYAYSRLYPDDYSMKNRFCMMLKKAREEGVLNAAIDKRSLRVFTPKYTEEYQNMAHEFLSDPRAFDTVMCHEKIQEVCEDLQIEAPSVWWVRDYYRKNRNFINITRHGKEVYEKEQRPYANIIPALHRNTQWQIDGWEIPIYGKRQREDGSWELYFKYVFFAVLDAHSRKYVGYCVGESENTEVILKALENAVKNTGVLPYEIVSDNHSFNKTKEAEHFKAALDKIGVHWTVDSNPRRKAILERSFRTLSEKHLKNHYGYIGAGIRSKKKGSRMPQELIDEYTKNSSRMPNFDTIATSVISSVLEYNDKVKPKFKQSPNERYEASEQPKCFEVDVFKRMQLFTRKSEQTVSNGQISIKRGMYEYTYQLPAKLSTQYNGKTVCLRYSDFEHIYLYDIENDNPICSLYRKLEIHGAMGDQTDADVKKLHKNTGRLKGIKSKLRKQKSTLSVQADTLNPNAAEAMNKIKTPKDVVKQVEQDFRLRESALNQGVKPERVTEMSVIGMLKTEETERKENRHPFSVKQGEIRKISIEELAESVSFRQ